jgi:hypothetical protein
MIENRILRALRAIIEEVTAPFVNHALVRYRIVRNTVGRLELQIVRKSTRWPDVLPVSVHQAHGIKGEPQVGGVVLVSFIEGDETMPVVTHFARPEDGAWLPNSCTVDASGTVKIGPSSSGVELGPGAALPMARIGDMVQVISTAPGTPAYGFILAGNPLLKG